MAHLTFFRALLLSLPCLGALLPSCVLAQNSVHLTPKVLAPDQSIDRLGFARDGTRLNDDGYAQLLVGIVVPSHLDIIELNNCPREEHLWNIDLRNLTLGDTTATLGVRIEGPVVPAVNYTPVVITGRAKRFTGRRCDVQIDPFLYRSPLFSVRKYENVSFKVTPTYTHSREMAPSVRQDMDQLFGALALVAGVPAVGAAPYLSTLNEGLESLGSDGRDSIAHYFPVRSGPVIAPQKWIVPATLTSPDGKQSNGSVMVVAQLVPVASALPKPSAVPQWRPGLVLNSPYRFEKPIAGGNDTLSAYLYSVAGREIDTYSSATRAEANVACTALARRVDEMGLSERDSALTLWAIAKRRAENGLSSEAEVDNLSCLRDRWDMLSALGIARVDAPKSGAAPTVRQMKGSVDVDEALALFFRSPTWEGRKRYAATLFSYPVGLNDPDHRMMREATVLESRDTWVANAFERDQPLLAKVGCYVFFDGNAAHPVSEATGQSVMLAFGERPAEASSTAGELVLRMTFAPTTPNEDPRINQISVLNAISDDVRAAALQALGPGQQCRSGYRPRLLFERN